MKKRGLLDRSGHGGPLVLYRYFFATGARVPAVVGPSTVI